VCRLSGWLQVVFYRRELLPGDVAWIGCSHTVSAFSVVLFYYTSAFEFCKDIEQALRKPRILEFLTWYLVSTAVNRHEPIFLDRQAVALFNRVFREAGERYPCEVRYLRIEVDRVTFCVKLADGFMLPFFMQWLKQTFACRYNAMKRLDGHVWGDRYWSKVLEGEPPEEVIPAGGSGRGDCGEDGGEGRAEAGGLIPKARPREGPPGGKYLFRAAFPPPHRPLNRPPAANRPG
jgi:REP element-mobilizing transposase RayT